MSNILPLGKIHFVIWTNIFAIFPNTLCNLDKFLLHLGKYMLTLSISINWKRVLLLGPKASLPLEISFIVLSPTCPLFCHLVKYILPLGHIHFAIWTNTFCNLDKYTLPFRPLPGTIFVRIHSAVHIFNSVCIYPVL